jgi:hypothetical protein
MSTNPEFDRIVTLEPGVNGAEAAPPVTVEAAPVPYAPAAFAPVETAPPPVQEAYAPFPALAAPIPAPEQVLVPIPVSPARKRPGWLVPAAIAAVGLIASGTLGYFLYTASNKLDATRHQLFVTQGTLAATKQDLATAKSDAAAKKETADYVALYVADSGKVNIDYAQVAACNNFSSCRTASQQALADMQTFQSDRRSATVPSSLSTSDSQLGDSLSAGIAALQELISGMDGNSQNKINDGFTKLNDAMLSMAKAEAALGAELK